MWQGSQIKHHIGRTNIIGSVIYIYPGKCHIQYFLSTIIHLIEESVPIKNNNSCLQFTIIYGGRYWGQYCGDRIVSVGVLGFDKFRGGVLTCQTRLIVLGSKLFDLFIRGCVI